jgi:hypothetical protein
VKRRFLIVFCLATTAAGCGGGGGGAGPAPLNPPANSPPPANAPPVTNKSAGGIWHGSSTANETITLFVAETGELRTISTTGAPGANPPAFGSGAVLVSGGDLLDGAFDSRLLSAATSDKCTFTGTVIERVSLNVNVECTDGAGVKRSASTVLGYDSDYEGGSGLSTIAGNYVMGVGATTNFLNIDGNGVIFGTYDNGPNCTVNGMVKLVDPRWNLYRFEWQLSLCKRLVQFEGATLTGFGIARPRGAKPGSFLVLLTGMVAGRLEAASVMYQPP